MAKAQQLEVAREPTSAPTLVSMISAVVARPDVDVGKIADLLAMQRLAEADAALRAYMTASNEVQRAMEPIVRNAPNGQTKSKYATHEALDRALRPIYTEHGFSISFNTADSPLAEHVRVLCYLQHIGGHREVYQCDIPCDGKGAKGNDVMTKTHAVGSAMTYGKRYLLALAFNIALTDTDDDGNGASAKVASGLVSDAQSTELLRLLKNDKALETRILTWVGKAMKSAPPKTVSDIPARLYENVVVLINRVAK
jgi:hypothetical protein